MKKNSQTTTTTTVVLILLVSYEKLLFYVVKSLENKMNKLQYKMHFDMCENGRDMIANFAKSFTTTAAAIN